MAALTPEFQADTITVTVWHTTSHPTIWFSTVLSSAWFTLFCHAHFTVLSANRTHYQYKRDRERERESLNLLGNENLKTLEVQFWLSRSCYATTHVELLQISCALVLHHHRFYSSCRMQRSMCNQELPHMTCLCTSQCSLFIWKGSENWLVSSWWFLVLKTKGCFYEQTLSDHTYRQFVANTTHRRDGDREGRWMLHYYIREVI